MGHSAEQRDHARDRTRAAPGAARDRFWRRAGRDRRTARRAQHLRGPALPGHGPAHSDGRRDVRRGVHRVRAGRRHRQLRR